MVSCGGDLGYRDWYGGGFWVCCEKLGWFGGFVYVRIGELL